MSSPRRVLILLMISFIGPSIQAQSRKLTFQSSADKFDLVLSGGSGTINGKPADLRSIQDMLPVLTNPLGSACPELKGRPEITVREGTTLKSIYVKEGIITDGTNCLNAAGDGLFYFPIHRDFLIGPKADALKIASPLKIFRQGVKVLDIKKKDGVWVSENPDQLVNWDFLDRFENSLKDFDVRLRVQAGIGEGKPKMNVQSGSVTYEFYKVTNVMWAVKKPGAAWLMASDDWSFWHDFEASMLEDRYAEDIRQLQAAGTPKETRLGLLDKLDGAWSRNLRDLYHKFLTDYNEDHDVQEIALKRLKRKPSKETSGVMVQFLENSPNEDLKDDAGVILKLFYPKGPKFSSRLSASEKAKALDFWRNWWSQNRNKN